MQYWARRLEQEIDGVMRIFGGVQQLRGVSCPSFTCAAFLVAMNVLICRNHLCEHSQQVTSQLTPCAGAWLAALLVASRFDAFIKRVAVRVLHLSVPLRLHVTATRACTCVSIWHANCTFHPAVLPGTEGSLICVLVPNFVDKEAFKG